MILLLSPGLHSWYALPLGSGCSGCSGPPGYTMLYTCLPLVSYSPAWPGNLSLEKQDQERDANEIRALAVFFFARLGSAASSGLEESSVPKPQRHSTILGCQ